jgi:hypothetical protein
MRAACVGAATVYTCGVAASVATALASASMLPVPDVDAPPGWLVPYTRERLLLHRIMGRPALAYAVSFCTVATVSSLAPLTTIAL